MEKEQWIDDVLNSANGLRKLQPHENLLQRIKDSTAANKVDYKTLWLVAASVIVLVLLNLRALGVAGTVKQRVTESQADNPFLTSNQLY